MRIRALLLYVATRSAGLSPARCHPYLGQTPMCRAVLFVSRLRLLVAFYSDTMEVGRPGTLSLQRSTLQLVSELCQVLFAFLAISYCWLIRAVCLLKHITAVNSNLTRWCAMHCTGITGGVESMHQFAASFFPDTVGAPDRDFYCKCVLPAHHFDPHMDAQQIDKFNTVDLLSTYKHC